MTNIYEPVSTRAKVIFGDDAFEADFSPIEERDYLDAGHLAIVPRAYEVLSNNFAAGKQGDTVDLALVVENESALIEGGHIKRVDKPAAKKKAASS